MIQQYFVRFIFFSWNTGQRVIQFHTCFRGLTFSIFLVLCQLTIMNAGHAVTTSRLFRVCLRTL